MGINSPRSASMLNERYLATFTIEKYTIPTVDQLLATASRLGADVNGSMFDALTAIGFDAWITKADEEHQLIAHIPVKEYRGHPRGSEERILYDQLYRYRRLPAYS